MEKAVEVLEAEELEGLSIALDELFCVDDEFRYTISPSTPRLTPDVTLTSVPSTPEANHPSVFSSEVLLPVPAGPELVCSDDQSRRE